VAKRSGHEVLRIDPALTIKEKDIDAFMYSLNEILHQQGCIAACKYDLVVK